MAQAAPTRRQRVRDATTDEILSVARDLVARDGAAGLSLRAVARTMGMAPSALYRYYPSREALLTALIIEAYDTLGQAVEDAIAQFPPDGTCSGMLAGAHAFRSWAVAHPHEFGLVYGTPVPGYNAPEDTQAPAMRTPTALLGVLRAALDDGVIALPLTDDQLPEPVASALQEVAEHKEEGFSQAAVAAAMQCWAVLLGLVAGEVFSHLPVALMTQAPAFFDFTMRRTLLAMGATPQSLARAISPAQAADLTGGGPR